MINFLKKEIEFNKKDKLFLLFGFLFETISVLAVFYLKIELNLQNTKIKLLNLMKCLDDTREDEISYIRKYTSKLFDEDSMYQNHILCHLVSYLVNV